MSFMLAVEMERYLLLHLTLKAMLVIIMECISLVLSLTKGCLFFSCCAYFKKYGFIDDVLSLDVSFSNTPYRFNCNSLFELHIYFVKLNNLVACINCLVLPRSSYMIVTICQLQ